MKDHVIVPPPKGIAVELYAVWTIAMQGKMYRFFLRTCSFLNIWRNRFSLLQNRARNLMLAEVGKDVFGLVLG